MASNVYTKLNQARIKMQEYGLKQTGVNDFAKYKYFELDEILPVNNKICAEINATTVCNFDNAGAVLYFIDCDKPEDRIAFTSPMSSASLKGCHEVQNLGAVETYIKRYLYQSLYELSEKDALDKTMNPNEPKPKAEPKVTEVTPKTKAEAELIVKKFEALAGENFISQESLTKMQSAYTKLKSENDYRSFIANCNKNIEAAEKAKAEFKDDDIPF